ncbi:IucA/IucC family siderophore biosynthesis protein [Mechercharimyces sp. CAU 1602]|uniref:IucA/IucC family protein n=1 Tax=Mechercharimyces sp. CAU 1602 TaxID=2973933 RepID=UPI002162A31D|nr:IucA/IucC family protein [Mechercharimyces sp. CAU 1602]MCS1352739.1 IucA/IucC family siderophore biosynthesis protein [Mechercharimyces sp. CAU 1602]
MSTSIAEHASMQSFFNCYLREVGKYQLSSREELCQEAKYQLLLDESSAVRFVRSELHHHGMEIVAPLQYWSQTGRHLFQAPFYYLTGEKHHVHRLDFATMITMITKELAIAGDKEARIDELVYRSLQSAQHIEQFVEARQADKEELYASSFTYIEAEQSLVFGHLLHPTPKSRQGISDGEQRLYAPELKGHHSMHYFRAHHSIVQEDSTLEVSASEAIKAELRRDDTITTAWKEKFLQTDDEYAIIPVHPLQAKHVLQDKAVQTLMEQGLLQDLGRLGRAYAPTSSLRTVYHRDARFMLKGSIPIKITNSVRLNKMKELERGVEVTRILESKIGKELYQHHPAFRIVKDPAYITIKIAGREESGFEMVLRENPFAEGNDQSVSLVAGLCQDAMELGSSRLAVIMKELAKSEGRSTSEVSEEWFKKYLAISLEPMMWLYMTYGIALEAHQQNSVVELENGYPSRFYYRDNQGYYYCESTFPSLQEAVPGINEKSYTMCKDEVADERLRYYLFMNHLVGLINAFGVAELVAEERLLEMVAFSLQKWMPHNRKPSTLLQSLLEQEVIPCKANLLTRLYDMDELVGPMESQSVYVDVINPIRLGVKVKV